MARRIALALGLGVLAAVSAAVLAPSAAGHAVLVSSVPADDAIVRAAPPVIELVFSEPVETVGAEVSVIAADGTRIATDAPVARGRTLSVAPTADVPEGSVTVAWSALSADGHRIDGAIGFAVRVRSEPAADVTAAVAAVSASTAPPRGASAAASAVRAARFAAIVALVGIVTAMLGVWLPALRRGKATEAVDAAVRRGLSRFAVACGGVLALAALAWIPVEAWANGIGVMDALGLRQGSVDLAMLALGLLAIPLAVLGIRGRHVPALLGLALAVVSLALLPALAGHPIGESPAWPSVLVDWAHVLAAGVWGGGVIALAASAPALLGATTPSERGPIVIAVVRRFTRLALLALAVLVASGVTAALLYAESLRAVPETRWGQVLIAKVVIVVLAIVVAALVRRGRRGYGSAVRAEALLIVTAIALTGVLTGLSPTPPATAATGGPLSAQTQAAGIILQLDVSPARAGAPNEVHLIAIAADGSPAAGVREGEVVLSSRGNGVQRLPVRLQRAERGHWIGAVVIPAPGDWRGTGRVRVGEIGEVIVRGAFRVIPSDG